MHSEKYSGLSENDRRMTGESVEEGSKTGIEANAEAETIGGEVLDASRQTVDELEQEVDKRYKYTTYAAGGLIAGGLRLLKAAGVEVPVDEVTDYGQFLAAVAVTVSAGAGAYNLGKGLYYQGKLDGLREKFGFSKNESES
jgi:hypothetical protein